MANVMTVVDTVVVDVATDKSYLVEVLYCVAEGGRSFHKYRITGNGHLIEGDFEYADAAGARAAALIYIDEGL